MLHFLPVKIGDKGQEKKTPHGGDCESEVRTTQPERGPRCEFIWKLVLEKGW